jgi:hypothetical protein
MLQRLPVIGKDLLEDTPVQRRGCTHRLALSWGDTLVTVQRLYHALPASSTPHQSVPGHPSPVSFILELWRLLGPGKCIFLLCCRCCPASLWPLCCRCCQASLWMFFPPFWTHCGTGPRLLWRLPVVWEPRISHDGLSVRALTPGNHFSMHLERHKQPEPLPRPACAVTSLDVAGGCERSYAVRAGTRRGVAPDAPESPGH